MSDQFNMESMRAMMKAMVSEKLKGIAKAENIKGIAKEVSETRHEVKAVAARVDEVDEEMADLRAEIDKSKLGLRARRSRHGLPQGLPPARAPSGVQAATPPHGALAWCNGAVGRRAGQGTARNSVGNKPSTCTNSSPRKSGRKSTGCGGSPLVRNQGLVAEGNDA